MVFPRGLKRVCDICFYMAFASILGFAMDLGGNLILTLPIFATVAFLSAFLAPHGMIKYISLLLMPTVFLVTPPSIGSIAIFIPIMIYLFWSMPKPDERMWQFDYQPTFRLFLKIYGLIIGLLFVVALFTIGLDGNVLTFFPTDSVLFATMFLISATMFLRIRRHDEIIQKQMRFNVVSAIPFISMLLVAILASSERVMSAILFLIRFIWFGIVLQLFDLIARFLIFVFPNFTINRLDDPEPVAMTLPWGEEMETFYMDIPEDWREIIEVADGAWFTIFLIIVAVVVLIIIFRVFSKKVGSADVRDDGVEEERFALDDPKGKKKRRRQNENSVREVYRSFLELIKEQGMELKLHSTSGEIEEQVIRKFNSKKSRELREKYIQVRYREDVYTKDDIKQVKGLYKEIKKEIEK